MAHCSCLSVCIGVLTTIRTANGALFCFVSVYWSVNDCIRTANGAQFLFVSMYWGANDYQDSQWRTVLLCQFVLVC